MATSAPVADFEVPGHRLVRPLGKGGMATVYLAIQASLGRPVAVKVLQAPSDEAVTRFEQEARTIARLQHPNIVSIYEVGRTSDGQLYYTMPYLPNGDLSKLDLREAPARVAAVIRALVGALGHAHQHGIVHRDVKPENVLFDQHRRPLLTDFGIARASDGLRVTREGATMGSSGYMSPEQARGQDLDGRSDLYSVGVVCFELLAGSLPFHGVDALSTAIAHIEQPVPRLPSLKRVWQPLIDRALAKSPEDRFQNADEMLAALDAIDGRHTTITGTHKPTPAAKLAQRLPVAPNRRMLWGGVAALIVLVALVASVWAWRAHAPRTVAPQADAPPAATHLVPVAAAEAASQANGHGSTPAGANGTAADPAQIALLVLQGDNLLAQNAWTEPKGASAADRYLAALKLQPGNTAAHAGIGKIVAKLQQSIDKAWKHNDADHIGALVKKADVLAPSADASSQERWRAARTQLAATVGAALADAAHARDVGRIAALRPLAEALPATYPAGFDIKDLDHPPPPALHAGAPMRDDGGPALVYVPAAGNNAAFAIGRTDVTRAEYAEFARETHRAPAHCVEPLNPFSGLRGLKWSDPGFAQGGDHPVVCVSWNDAVAYAAWLSRKTGQSYRLPDDDEWLRTAHGGGGGNPCVRGDVDDHSRQSAFDNDAWPCSDGAAQTAPVGRYVASGVGAYDMYGNVSAWLAGGAARDRVFRGLSWRDGSHETALGRRGTASSDTGYTNVGFRVVRAIDPAHPTPQG